MSYANGTQHYNLPQTQGSDKRDWFDTNEAFRNVDSDLYTAKQTAETTAGSLATTNENVTGVANRVTATENSIQTLQGNLATTNENVSTNSTAIASLQTAVADNKQDLEDMITAYEEATATASRRYDVGDYFRYNDVLYITTVVITQGSTIVPDVNCESTNVMTRVKALESGGGQSPSASSVLYDNTTSGLTGDNVQSAIDELDGTLDNVSQGVQTNGTHIGDLTTLETTAKGNLVAAINEVLEMIGGGRMLDLSNNIKHQTSFTTQSDGVIIINIRGVETTIDIGGVVLTTPVNGLAQTVIDGISSGTSVTITGTLSGNDCLYEVPYV